MLGVFLLIGVELIVLENYPDLKASHAIVSEDDYKQYQIGDKYCRD